MCMDERKRVEFSQKRKIFRGKILHLNFVLFPNTHFVLFRSHLGDPFCLSSHLSLIPPLLVRIMEKIENIL